MDFILSISKVEDVAAVILTVVGSRVLENDNTWQTFTATTAGSLHWPGTQQKANSNWAFIFEVSSLRLSVRLF